MGSGGATQFVTGDMSLVAVLSLYGYEGEMKSEDGHVSWSYEEHDEQFVRVLTDYRQGDCRVDPLRFSREIATVRRAMYNLLGVTPKRVAPPPR